MDNTAPRFVRNYALKAIKDAKHSIGMKEYRTEY